MSITTDIVQGWLHPQKVMQRHLARGTSEPFAFSLLVTFLVLVFVSLWPQLSRQSLLQPEVPMVQRLVAAGLALLASVPVWYGVAALSHWIALLFGGAGNHFRARLALFAALVAVTPAMLLQGLVAGMIGQGPQLLSVQALVGLGFVWIWISMLRVAERDHAD
ncbi:YIP1 family protein [Cypionkella sp.]|uniref:YIP1 family protein n=1 Tax=Cypionkella sp. TaxID=2811411 RepID=UPI0037519E9C